MDNFFIRWKIEEFCFYTLFVPPTCSGAVRVDHRCNRYRLMQDCMKTSVVVYAQLSREKRFFFKIKPKYWQNSSFCVYLFKVVVGGNGFTACFSLKFIIYIMYTYILHKKSSFHYILFNCSLLKLFLLPFLPCVKVLSIAYFGVCE